MRQLGLLLVIACSGCVRQAQTFTVESPAYYAKQLYNAEFVWHGPVSREDRIPKLHAARALAFIGDDGVEYLLDAIDDPQIDAASVYDALAEIGLPVERFRTQIIVERDSTAISQWWQNHGTESAPSRQQYRETIGL